MEVAELADRLRRDLELVIGDRHVAASVRLSPFRESRGPFVEVRPSVLSDAPTLTIHVLDDRSLSIAIGDDTSADCAGPSQSIIRTVLVLAQALFHGDLQEEVTRGRSGRVITSKLILATETGTRVLWRRYSAGSFSFQPKTRQRRKFAAYPLAP